MAVNAQRRNIRRGMLTRYWSIGIREISVFNWWPQPCPEVKWGVQSTDLVEEG